jgi:ABC-type lipoprotein export system ATPase subunit
MREVVKTYDTPAGPFEALKSVDLKVGAGEFAAVIGKSGSGKSTLINMITGIDRASSGEVIVAGTSVQKLSEAQMASWRGRNVGVVFQFFQLLPTLTVAENVTLPMDFVGKVSRHARAARAVALLEQVGMAAQASKLPSELSGGQQQRVAIARALANDPPLLVADEPTGNLDSRTAHAVFELFEHLVADGKTIVMVTHDNDLARRARRTVLVADGEIVNEYVTRTFSALDVDQLAVVSSHLDRERCAPGTVIIREGDLANRFYIVVEGKVEVYLAHRSGQHVVVAEQGPGFYFGEVALLQGGQQKASVRADHQAGCEVLSLDRETFEDMARQSDALRRKFAAAIEERLRQLGAVSRAPA